MECIYAFKNAKEEVMKSSSGGAFISLCKTMESLYGKNNVTFYGVVLNENLEVVHNRVEDSDQCFVFQGAKYVKSILSPSIYDMIAEDLKLNKHVLFSGTPCQIAGVKKNLEIRKIEYENILFVDVICHGTPTRNVWNDYKKWLEKKYKNELSDFIFRNKNEGWKGYPALAKFKNGLILNNTAETSIYSKLHMLGYITNEGCFKCQYSNLQRISDITLGDFWGCEVLIKKENLEDGVSLILANTDKGINIIKNIKKTNIDFLIKYENNDFLIFQHNLNNPSTRPNNYDDFWKDYKSFGFDYIIRKYGKYNMKYIIKFKIKKMFRKTMFISLYRKTKYFIKLKKAKHNKGELYENKNK